MSKATKEMLKTILGNQELIMKHLKITMPAAVKDAPKKTERKPASKAKPAKKAAGKKR